MSPGKANPSQKQVLISRSDHVPSWNAVLTDRASGPVLEEFKDLGGDVAFLRHLWEAWPQWAGESAPVSARSHQKWEVVHHRAQSLLQALDEIEENSLAVGDERLHWRALGSAQFVERWARSHKKVLPDVGRRKSHPDRQFWCSALLPYLAWVGGAHRRWKWLADWLSLMEPAGVEPKALKMWWKESVLRPMVKATLRRGVSKGVTGLRSRDPIFESAFEYLSWKDGRKIRWSGGVGRVELARKRKALASEARRYQRFILREMPFFQKLGWVEGV